MTREVAMLVNLKISDVKNKRKLKKYLNILKKEKADICEEMEMDYMVIKYKLIDCYHWEMKFRKAVKMVKAKKRFRKALAKKLGVRYSEINHLFPSGLNSTLIANYLNPHFAFFTHEEIRDICQELKLGFHDFP